MDDRNPWADDASTPRPLARGPAPMAATAACQSTTVAVDGPERQGSDGILLLVFIHGFKGSAESTFEDFPNRLAHVLAETHPGVKVLPVIYPTYDTRGALDIAVTNFVEWLTSQVLTLESKPELDAETGREKSFAESGKGGGKGSVKVALLGHSMGGLVAVDATLKVAGESSGSVLWPSIVAVIAFDSPYYGVHPNVFRHQATKYISYAQQARDLGTHFAPIGAGLAAVWGMNRKQQPQQQPQRQAATSASSGGASRWTSALLAGGAFATAAAGGAAAYYKRDQINGAYSYLTDHFEYVSNLWDDGGLKARLDALVEMPSVLFHAYYNYLPSSSSSRARTFIVLPPLSSQHTARLFSPVQSLAASDEIDAHVSMFSPTRNPPGYIELVQGSAYLLGMASSSLISATRTSGPQQGRAGHAKRAGAQHDQSENQRRGEAKKPLEREEGLRQGDQGLRAEEEKLVSSMKAQRQGPRTRAQTRSQNASDSLTESSSTENH